MKALVKAVKARVRALTGAKPRMRVDYRADGLGVVNRNLGFMADPAFEAAWAKTVAANREGWNGAVPDVRWRAHVAVWAARHGLARAGDFVECGVHTGLLSIMICEMLGFAGLDRRFYLYDTFGGIPLDGLDGEARVKAEAANASVYGDVWSVAQRNFAPYPNAVLVRGALPGTLGEEPSRIAYLSVDLNHAGAEKAVIERLWPRLSPGAIVLIDDYGFAGNGDQTAMWNAFAAAEGLAIATLPTGQGLLIKP